MRTTIPLFTIQEERKTMKSGHHGFLLTLPPAFKNPPDSKIQFQKQFESNTSHSLLTRTDTDRYNNNIYDKIQI